MRADEWKVTMQPEKENDMRDPSDPYEEAFPDFRAAMDKALAAIEKFRNGEVSREEHDAVLKEAKRPSKQRRKKSGRKVRPRQSDGGLNEHAQ
jgi:hypothetical protein